jgi:hypothetical protein
MEIEKVKKSSANVTVRDVSERGKSDIPINKTKICFHQVVIHIVKIVQRYTATITHKS